MKRFYGKFLAGLLALGLLLGNMNLAAEAAEDAGNAPAGTAAEDSAPMPFRDMTADEIVAEMGTGWNLGNTMDGHTGFTPGETIWQDVETTQELIRAVHDAGFNTVRVPVTWGTMIDDSNGYAIDDKWMSRVQDIVDYCINMNMYVIINVHHDGAEQSGWLRIGAEDLDPVKEKFAAVWKQIAERFRDYDEHLIFESMNEVVGPDNSNAGIAKDTQVIMELNQIFVDTVRATGSNNVYRWLSVPGRYTNIVNSTSDAAGFDVPEDSTPGRLFVAVHHYDWTFGLLENMNDTTFELANFNNLIDQFGDLVEKFTSRGIPVILGEYGAINKNNTADRTYHMEGMNRLCQLSGVVPVYWDQGWYDLSLNPDYSFTLFDRAACEEIYPEIIDGIMRGYYLQGEADLSDIEMDAAVTPITDLGTWEGTVTAAVGEVADISLADYVDKSAFNDTIVWKSADETVATVNGDSSDLSVWAANIHATGMGRTVITASSRDGGAVLEIPVEVKAQETANPGTEIVLEQESYEVMEEQYFFLNASLQPADTDAFLTYRSSDPEVATVSRIGKVVAKAEGTTYIIINSSDGLTRVVPVTVKGAEAKAEIALALNVYYNDSELSYFSNEYGEAVTVSGEGQYTVVFDCAQDLSDNAVNAGVTGLNNLTAIYIKDDSVTRGQAKKSALVSCDIIYDEIKVDGTSYTIHMDAPKSALKASGIFDTNDPINSWDGSVIDEVRVDNHVLNFSAIEDPQKVELTFTLSNLVFEEGTSGVQATEASGIEAKEASVTAVSGQPTAVAVTVSPAGSGKVTFVSSDPSVAAVSHLAVADQNGAASAEVYALGTGTATITAYTENGLTAEIQVTASAAEQEVGTEGTEAQESSEEAESPASADSAEAPENREAAEDARTAESSPAQEGVSTGFIVGMIILAVAVFAGVFFLTVKLVSGSGKKDEKKEEK